jgi:transcriptional regulator with XRE-family HTH domain
VPNLSANIANVNSESDAQPRRVTPDQVAAWNMAYWRKRAGLTQAQLGERIGWTNAAVSEAERSWDGGRTREFNARLLLAVAAALGVPLTALLLPPEDAGAYEITLDGGTPALMELIMPDLDGESAVLEAYRARVRRAAVAWLAPDLAADVARLLGVIDDKEFAVVTAVRLRAVLADAGEALKVIGGVADRIEEAGQ